MILLDTSALAKLMIEEEHSSAVRGYLFERSRKGEEMVISSLAVTELRRLSIRLGIPDTAVEPIVSRFSILRLEEAVLQLAGRLPPRHLGTLDAIHLATALAAGATTMVTYDRQLAVVAPLEGVEAVTPTKAPPNAR